jgi:hypothetical protein
MKLTFQLKCATFVFFFLVAMTVIAPINAEEAEEPETTPTTYESTPSVEADSDETSDDTPEYFE